MEELYEFAGSEAIPFVLFAGGSLTASEAHELWTAAQDNRLPLVLVEAALEEAGMSISAEVKGRPCVTSYRRRHAVVGAIRRPRYVSAPVFGVHNKEVMAQPTQYTAWAFCFCGTSNL